MKTKSANISKFRGIDIKVFEFIKVHKVCTKAMLRKEFVMYGEGAVKYSLNSLQHKKLISVKKDVVTFLEKL